MRPIHCRCWPRFLGGSAAVLAVVCAGGPGLAPPQGQEPPEKAAAPAAEAPPDAETGQGRLIRVRLPLVGNSDAHLKSAIQRGLAKLAKGPRRDDRRPVLILEFSPGRRDGGNGTGTEYSRALSLAQFLTSKELAPIKTVAYIPRTIKGHGVLVALACEEIVMNPDAEMGEAGIDEDATGTIPEGTLGVYREIAAMRRPAYQAIVLGMLDPRLEVLKVETDKGIEFVLRSGLDELKKERTVVSEETLFPAGSPGVLTGRQGRELGFVRLLASDADELARGLGVSREAVLEDQSLVGDWRPVMININQPLTRRTEHQIETLIGREIERNNVNWIGLRIDSSDGEMEQCLALANKLAALRSDEIQTVAYVPREASGGAALVALACDQLVMQPEARLQSASATNVDRRALRQATESIRDSLSQNSSRSWSLLAATIDPNLELAAYHNTQTGETQYFCEQEAAEADKKTWRKGEVIKAAGERLSLTSERAHSLDLAWQVVDGFDEFKRLYGFENDPREARPNWALELVEAVSSPTLAWLLLAIGFIGIYVELHAPGIGVGAFVAAVAFMLYFWGNYLNGTAGWLEVLLFVGGLFFLALEVFVLPGFGIFGLGGGVMVLASLVLASQTAFIPQTQSQLAELRRSLTMVTGAAVITIAVAVALRRYLPQAPVFRTILLNPPAEEDLIDLDYREALAEFSHLVGQQGVAATKLMPSGKAEFDGELVDVIAEGVPIDRGAKVVVIKARGSRVVVREVPA